LNHSRVWDFNLNSLKASSSSSQVQAVSTVTASVPDEGWLMAGASAVHPPAMHWNERDGDHHKEVASAFSRRVLTHCATSPACGQMCRHLGLVGLPARLCGLAARQSEAERARTLTSDRCTDAAGAGLWRPQSLAGRWRVSGRCLVPIGRATWACHLGVPLGRATWACHLGVPLGHPSMAASIHPTITTCTAHPYT